MSTTMDEKSEPVAGPVERPVWPLEIAAALRAYQQGDMDGLMVLVSRQACEEGAEWLERLNREAKVRYYKREQALDKCAHCGEKFTLPRSTSIDAIDTAGLFCTLRCAARYGTRAAEARLL